MRYLDRINRLVTAELTATQYLAKWARELVDALNQSTPATGTGSPEGVVSAKTGKQYIDTAGAPGSVLYVKQVDDVAGDTSKGWTL